MSIELTYWAGASPGGPDDFDELFTIRLKSVKRIPELVKCMPAATKMISTNRTNSVKHKNGVTTNYFKEIWRQGQPLPQIPEPTRCPLCNRLKITEFESE